MGERMTMLERIERFEEWLLRKPRTCVAHLSVRPRYTAGSPGLVPVTTGMRVAREELDAFLYTLGGRYGSEKAALAAREGLAGIVVARRGDESYDVLAPDAAPAKPKKATRIKPRPRCYGCGKRARLGSLFCTNWCGANYADELIAGNEDVYCPEAKSWESTSLGECHGCHKTADDHVNSRDWVFGD
jgi:hypothetical protein